MAGQGSSSARYQLLGSEGRGLGNAGTSSWGDMAGDDSDDDFDTRNLSVPQIKQKQYQAIEEQDRGLEQLSEVITRQKHLARTIGDEVDLQNELIDDITTHVDRTRDRIRGETQRVVTIGRRDNTCGYWTVIIVLFIVIIIIVLL